MVADEASATLRERPLPMPSVDVVEDAGVVTTEIPLVELVGEFVAVDEREEETRADETLLAESLLMGHAWDQGRH